MGKLNKNLKIGTLNIRGHPKNKEEEIKKRFRQEKLDVMVLTETKMGKLIEWPEVRRYKGVGTQIITKLELEHRIYLPFAKKDEDGNIIYSFIILSYDKFNIVGGYIPKGETLP